MIQRRLNSAKDDAAGDWSDARLAHVAVDALPPPPSSDLPLATLPATRLDRLGDYELLEEVARGGMGVVYKARQTSLDRIVAVKMIRDSALARPEDVARFQSEAAAAARLRHPNIVAIHEVGQHAGRHFFSMDYIEGSSLAEIARESPLAQSAAAALVITIAEAVQAAHDHGILHRDLKPSNVLIDAQGQPHVTDFGLAKRLEGDSQLTGSEQILGTPAYMPPEQARGVHQQIGLPSDVYALGAILYELLTGQPPFRGDSPVATIRQVLESEPVSPRRLNPAVSRDLETICLKCLEKEPGRRYPTARALVDELDRFVRGMPIQARPLGFQARAWRWCRRNPAPALALLLLLALAVGGPAAAVYSTALLQRATQAEDDRLAAQIRSLLAAAPEAVPVIVNELDRRRDIVVPQLVGLWNDPSLPEQERTRLSVFLYREGEQYADHAYERLLTGTPQECSMLWQVLAADASALVERLWLEAGDTEPSPRVLRAAAALATFDPQGECWQVLAPRVIQDLVHENSLNAAVWARQFEPVKGLLVPGLRQEFGDKSVERAAQRALAADLLASYAADDPQLLVELLTTADARQFNLLFPLLAAYSEQAAQLVEQHLDASLAAEPADWEDDSPEQASANLVIALLRLGRAERLWPLLRHTPDPTLRTQLIDRLIPLGVPAQALAARLAIELDVSSRRGLILALGEAQPAAIPVKLRDELVARLAELYRDDPDSGVFAAAEWTLRRWGREDLLRTVRQQSPSGGPSSPLVRVVTSEGQVMTVVRGPIEFVMGAPPNERSRYHPGNSEEQVVVRIPRSFAIALTEVTREEYLRFENDPVIQAEKKGQNIWHNEGWSLSFGPDPRCPHVALPWMVAARYCRWLSEKEGLPEEEICFPIPKSTHDLIRLPENYLDRTGYRMPTEAEWEYMARAGATTVRFFGRSPALLGKYAWHNSNSELRSWPVASLKPNDFGLFDVHGSVREWTISRQARRINPGASGIGVDSQDENLLIRAPDSVNTRGGSYNDHARFIRAACRETYTDAETGSNHNGLRLVRTIGLSE